MRTLGIRVGTRRIRVWERRISGGGAQGIKVGMGGIKVLKKEVGMLGMRGI